MKKMNRRRVVAGAGLGLASLGLAAPAEATRRPVSGNRQPKTSVVAPVTQNIQVAFKEASVGLRLSTATGSVRVLNSSQSATALNLLKGVNGITIYNDGNTTLKKGAQLKIIVRSLDAKGLVHDGSLLWAQGGMDSAGKARVLVTGGYQNGESVFTLAQDLPSGKSVFAGLSFCAEDGMDIASLSRLVFTASMTVNPTSQNYFEAIAPEKVADKY